MKIHVLTLFPEMIESALDHSILKRAQAQDKIRVHTHQIRDYAENKHRQVDDAPYGGGAGMVMTCQPIFSCIDALDLAEGTKIIYLSPKGKTLTQHKVRQLSQEKELVLLCGHYEGVDQRVIDHYHMEEVSIGDYILTGGELAAMVLIDAVGRVLPEVLGAEASHLDESFEGGLLEYPHYSRPEVFEGMAVPEVLMSGNHKIIEEWRLQMSLLLTKVRRPELFEAYLNNCDSEKKRQKLIKLMETDLSTQIKKKA